MSNEDVRTRLLNAAGPVFARRGYQAATVREICLAANVNVASVNYYFGDKETLYVETVKRARQLRARQFPMPNWPEGTAARTKLRDFITTMVFRIVAAEQADWSTRLMLREIIEPTGLCRSLVEEYVRPLFELLTDILSELLPDDVAEHIVRKTGFSIIGQCLYYRVAEGTIADLVPAKQRHEHYQPEQLAEHINHMCLASIGLAAPLGSNAKTEQPHDSSFECGRLQEHS